MCFLWEILPDTHYIHAVFLYRCSDMSYLDESNAVHNNQLAFSILEKELGISPIMSAQDVATSGQIDKLSMVLYLTQVHDAFSVPAKAQIKGNVCQPSQSQAVSLKG